MNIWQPYTSIDQDFALAQLWAFNRINGYQAAQTVEAGWQVYRQKYGDYRPRLFIFYTADGYGPKSCYNLDCGAFVQTSNRYVIGGAWTPSVTGGTQYSATYYWYKDGAEGHWWLSINNTWVGYYPRTLFDPFYMGRSASRIDVGGEVYVPTQSSLAYHSATDMGSGAFPSAGWSYAAYVRNIMEVTSPTTWTNFSSTAISITDQNCYSLSMLGSGTTWNTAFYYGGDRLPEWILRLKRNFGNA